jgi:SAM-dependent methyltransferase
VSALYDTIGRGNPTPRRADPRRARATHGALGDAHSVLNVGAGAASYEPDDRSVLAVEPSAVMIGQRPPGAAPVVQASAEELPFSDSSFDAVMAVLSDHHWRDGARGRRELRRVARRRVVMFTWDPSYAEAFWLTRDYLPRSRRLPVMDLEESRRWLGGARAETVPIPHDCRDGFYHAFWRRPHAYLDERVREGISVFARLRPEEKVDALDRLGADLQSGRWQKRNAELLSLDELDLGYRLLVCEL